MPHRYARHGGKRADKGILSELGRQLGGFVLMKEISAPVRTAGRKWGIVRLGYQP